MSDLDDTIELIYEKRIQIEKGIRDLKTLFGFRHLVLSKPTQDRVEIIFFLVIVSMGLLFLLFEKSGYRWSRFYNTTNRKEFSLIHVIKDVIRISWYNLCISPWFTLCSVVFDPI